MALVKNVNGTDVPLDAQEESDMLAYWAQGAADESAREAYEAWRAARPDSDSLMSGVLDALSKISVLGTDIGVECTACIDAYTAWKAAEVAKPVGVA